MDSSSNIMRICSFNSFHPFCLHQIRWIKRARKTLKPFQGHTNLSEESFIEPEGESRIDTCVECVVRDRDFSQKKVYHCELCERWFCERHLKPRLAFIRDLERVEHSPEIRVLYYTEMQREDGHPDFEYSRRKFNELAIAEKERTELIKRALDGMNAYYKTKSQHKGEKVEEENIVRKALPELGERKHKKGIISEGRFHFERGESQEPKRKWRFPRMRPWYWFLLILFLFDLALILLGEYYLSIAGEYMLGWQWMEEAIIPSVILLAIGALYFERWWKRHMRRFWNG